MKVIISTVKALPCKLNLARQMERIGILERFFTAANVDGRSLQMPGQKISTYPSTLQIPWRMIARSKVLHNTSIAPHLWRLLVGTPFDWYFAKHIVDCDIFHGDSISALRSGQAAKQKGAKWVCDVPHSHLEILSEIVRNEHDYLSIRPSEHQSMIGTSLKAYDFSDHIVVASAFAKSSFLSKRFPDEKISVVPYGVDTNLFKPVPVNRDEVFRVLFVGHLSAQKGVHYLLEAFGRASIPNSRLILAGSPHPDTPYILSRYPLEKVDILGGQPKSKLAFYYSLADVMVLPSVQDGFGLVICEAMACGCPVIATTNTGGPDVITDGVEGFIVPIRSPDAIAEKLVWLYEHPEERAKMGSLALKKVREWRGWRRYGEKMLKIYEKLLGVKNSLL
ncbi:glycosyltransferase family 4 protein [Desulfobacterota bacterium AH_259_B03_O07]|nr:glycosyltransferase family 4 protein [Desulfobacterota bacterium AH_259_B03_O07]